MLSLVTETGRLSAAVVIALTSLFFLTATAQAEKARAATKSDAKAVSPSDGVIKLYNGKNLDGLTTWLKDAKCWSKRKDPRGVFSVKDGVLHITGDGYGYVRTNERYRDYHLIVEYKWGKRTWGSRAKCARDSGLLVHCVGPDGSYSNIFMASIEVQIIEGGVGDFIAVPGKYADGRKITVKMSAETDKDRDGELVWKPGARKTTVEAFAQINWFGRDPDWEDKIDFRGPRDVDSPFGQWTRMDVICKGAEVTIIVNGVVVNKAYDVTPSAGQILVQSEGAEIFVRRWELWPLGKAPK